MHFRLVSAASILLASAAPVFAKDGTTGAADTADNAPEIVVTGQRQQYGVKSTTTGTKTNTDIKNIPQAMTVITEAQIEDQQLRSIADVLTFVPGAAPGTGEANRDQMTLRGNNTTADFFVDGIRDDVQYFRDLYNVDRIEVLRGSNAMIFGRGGGGGVVNRVLKRSSLGTAHEFSASVDSEGGFRLTGDLDQALSSSAGLRINGLYEEGDSFRRNVDLKRYGVNPTVAFMAGPNTRIDLSYEYFHDRRTTDRGVPSRAGRPLEGYDSIFFGDPGESYSQADVQIGTFAVHHDFGGGLTLRNRTLFGDYDKFYQNVYPSGPVLAATAPLPERFAIGAYNSRNDRRNLFTQTDLIWDGRIGGIDQTLLLGFELGRQKSRNQRQSGTIAGGNLVPLSNPTVDRGVVYAPVASDANNLTRANIAAVYVQDQIRLSPTFEIVAGLRFDSFKLDVDDVRNTTADFKRSDELWSPRLGLIFKPTPDLSLYGSYSRSYLPQSGDQFSGLTPVTDQLKPERFDNLEVGAKWELLEGLLATAAIYRLDRKNTQARDAQNQIVLTGAQRSKGVELGLERSMNHRWQISAGYALQKAEITETTASAPVGREVPLVPRHTFSLWNRYDVSGDLGLGLGIVARSKSFASITNAMVLPSYARVDAAAYYKIAKGVRAQVNVENLLGADYFPTAHNDNNVAPGAPRTFRATVRFGI